MTSWDYRSPRSSAAKSRIDMIRDSALKTIERAKARLAAVERFSETDPYWDGTVLRIERTHEGTGTVFTYVTVRVGGGKWYLTGDAGAGRYFDWPELVDWMVSSGDLNKLTVEIATGFVPAF